MVTVAILLPQLLRTIDYEESFAVNTLAMFARRTASAGVIMLMRDIRRSCFQRAARPSVGEAPYSDGYQKTASRLLDTDIANHSEKKSSATTGMRFNENYGNRVKTRVVSDRNKFTQNVLKQQLQTVIVLIRFYFALCVCTQLYCDMV